ncbi:MAG: hypothetical protein AB7V43_08070 [Acidimicrobiia bacterium]
MRFGIAAATVAIVAAACSGGDSGARCVDSFDSSLELTVSPRKLDAGETFTIDFARSAYDMRGTFELFSNQANSRVLAALLDEGTADGSRPPGFRLPSPTSVILEENIYHADSPVTLVTPPDVEGSMSLCNTFRSVGDTLTRRTLSDQCVCLELN